MLDEITEEGVVVVNEAVEAEEAENGTEKKAVNTYTVAVVRKLTMQRVPAIRRILKLTATGQVPSTGWKNAKLSPVVYVHPPEDGIWDFILTADAPHGYDPHDPIVHPILVSVEAACRWVVPHGAKGIRVHGRGIGILTAKL